MRKNWEIEKLSEKNAKIMGENSPIRINYEATVCVYHRTFSQRWLSSG